MRILTAALVLLLAAPANAHVAPSEDANNRYLKLTPTADRIRLSYTVFMGQQQGARERQRLDRDRDGMVSDEEAAVFGDRLAAEVAGGLEVTLDGQIVPVAWAQHQVGLGTPETRARAFSVDMVAWLCFPQAGPRHRLVLRDRFRLADPGETQVRVEESPGVTIARSILSGTQQSLLDFRWSGATTYLQEGLQVDVEVGADAPPGDGRCAEVDRSRRGESLSSETWVFGLLLALVLATIVAVMVRAARSSRRK